MGGLLRTLPALYLLDKDVKDRRDQLRNLAVLLGVLNEACDVGAGVLKFLKSCFHGRELLLNFFLLGGVLLRGNTILLVRDTAKDTILVEPFKQFCQFGLSPNTIRKHHANIQKCLDYAVWLGLIPYNPTNQTELPPEKKYHGAKAYMPAQTQEMLKVFEGDALETVVWLATAYGLRRSEVCGLRWEAVDLEQGTIQICHTAVVNNGRIIYSDETKTATSCRRLPLTGAMREYLLEVKKRQAEDKALFGGGYVDSGYVCVARDGTPISPNTVTHHFQRVLKANGLPCIRFHDLRHSVVYTLR